MFWTLTSFQSYPLPTGTSHRPSCVKPYTGQHRNASALNAENTSVEPRGAVRCPTRHFPGGLRARSSETSNCFSIRDRVTQHICFGRLPAAETETKRQRSRRKRSRRVEQ